MPFFEAFEFFALLSLSFRLSVFPSYFSSSSGFWAASSTCSAT